MKLPLPDLEVGNHYEYSGYTRTCSEVQLATLEDRLQLTYFIKTFNSENQYVKELDSTYRISALQNGGLIKRDNLGNKVYKYQKPDETIVRYISKGIVKPFIDNGDGTFTQSDWLKDQDGQYLLNEEFETATNEADFFVYLYDNLMLGEVKTWLINTFNDSKNMGRFEIEGDN